MSIQEWLLCTVMGTVPAGHRAIAGQMRYLQSPSVPKVLAFFMGGLSQGPWVLPKGLWENLWVFSSLKDGWIARAVA